MLSKWKVHVDYFLLITVQASSSSSDTSAGASNSNSESLFTQLPQPSAKKSLVVEEDDEFLHKKEKSNTVKPKAKITVPSLSDVSVLVNFQI